MKTIALGFVFSLQESKVQLGKIHFYFSQKIVEIAINIKNENSNFTDPLKFMCEMEVVLSELDCIRKKSYYRVQPC